jgi:hypothetical protein
VHFVCVISFDKSEYPVNLAFHLPRFVASSFSGSGGGNKLPLLRLSGDQGEWGPRLTSASGMLLTSGDSSKATGGP